MWKDIWKFLPLSLSFGQVYFDFVLKLQDHIIIWHSSTEANDVGISLQAIDKNNSASDILTSRLYIQDDLPTLTGT